MLKGNYHDAKQRLRECVTMQPNHILKGYALNNLALACWWHKIPLNDPKNFKVIFIILFSIFFKKENDANFKAIDDDFINVIPLFKNSIHNLENLDHLKDFLIKEKFVKLLDKEKIVPKESVTDLVFGNKESGKPLLNIGEFLFLTDPSKTSVKPYLDNIF